MRWSWKLNAGAAVSNVLIVPLSLVHGDTGNALGLILCAALNLLLAFASWNTEQMKGA